MSQKFYHSMMLALSVARTVITLIVALR